MERTLHSAGRRSADPRADALHEAPPHWPRRSLFHCVSCEMPVGDSVKSSKTDRDMPVLNLPETRLKTFSDDAPMHDDRTVLDCAVHRGEPPSVNRCRSRGVCFQGSAWRRPRTFSDSSASGASPRASVIQLISHGFHLLEHAPISRCMNMLENRGAADSIPAPPHVPRLQHVHSGE